MIGGLLSSFNNLDDLPEPLPKVEFTDRDPGYRPSAEEDPYNAFIRKCLVKGAQGGKLAGKRVGVKDCIAVAGVPLTNASKLCEGYVPTYDATVVTRVLREGATVIGKLNMDDFSWAGTSETSAFGAVRNPVNPDYSPGGSSSGSSAAVAAGYCDFALGVDQGGSVRMPAAAVGCVGIKATNGLVPSFGTTYLDHSIDCIGPIAKTVPETALALEVMAGEDLYNPQWVRGPIKAEQYTRALKADVKGIRIGFLKESTEWDHSEPDLNDAARKAADRFRELGATVEEISIPLFKEAFLIWSSIIITSTLAMVESEGEGYWHWGYYNTHWAETYGRYRRIRGNELPPMLKMALIVGAYLRDEYHNRYHCKAQNLRRLFAEQVNEQLKKYDAIATPTTAIKPVKLKAHMDLKELAQKGFGLVHNACPFNITGHPAISVPCAMRAGLPIGLQLVGRYWEESLLFRMANEFEQNVDWRKS
jgi:amidase